MTTPEQPFGQHFQVQVEPKVSSAALTNLDPDTFDWKAYTGTYKGRALITRLSHVTDLLLAQTPTPATLKLAREAALLAMAILKEETWDTTQYFHLVKQINASLNPRGARSDEIMDVDMASSKKGSESDGGVDPTWVEEVTAAAEAENAKLNVELAGYMSNLIRESIRLSHLAMAQLYRKTGSLGYALKNYGSVREHSAGPAHQLDLGLEIIEAAMEFNQPSPIGSNVNKIEAALDRLHPAVSSNAQPVNATMTQVQVQQNREMAERSQAVRRIVGVKLRVARGLSNLASGDYPNASRELLEVGEEGGLQEWEGEAISTSDMALIAATCALATRSRDYLCRILLDRASFHSSVDDSQGWILDLVRAFIDARYGEALSILNKAEPFMLLNPFLSRHTAKLMELIHKRALVQYLAPFSSVRIKDMATAFGTDEGAMLAEVRQLAEKGDVAIRIDLVDKVLTVKSKDMRAKAFRNGIEGGAQINSTIQSSIFRMRLKEAGVMVDPEREGGDSKPPKPSRSRSDAWLKSSVMA